MTTCESCSGYSLLGLFCVGKKIGMLNRVAKCVESRFRKCIYHFGMMGESNYYKLQPAARGGIESGSIYQHLAVKQHMVPFTCSELI